MAMSSDRAFETLRADILRGRHRPGLRLGEVGLARELGMSRTPVREALRRLAADGLVELSANRGARVVEPTTGDLDAVFVLRAHAEGLAARAAAECATPADVEELHRLALSVASAARPSDGGPPDLDALYVRNRQFHDLLLSLADSAVLAQVMAGLVHSTILMRTYRAFDEDAMHRSVAHHLELVAAIRAHDPDWAESVMRSHLFSARAALLGGRDEVRHPADELDHQPNGHHPTDHHRTARDTRHDDIPKHRTRSTGTPADAGHPTDEETS